MNDLIKEPVTEIGFTLHIFQGFGRLDLRHLGSDDAINHRPFHTHRRQYFPLGVVRRGAARILHAVHRGAYDVLIRGPVIAIYIIPVIDAACFEVQSFATDETTLPVSPSQHIIHPLTHWSAHFAHCEGSSTLCTIVSS